MKKRNIILIHALYWFYIINQYLFPLYIGGPEDMGATWNEYMKDVGISLFLSVISFYAVYFTFQRIIALKNIILIATSITLIIIILISLRSTIYWCFWKYLVKLPGKEMELEWGWVWNELRMVFVTGIYAILIRFMINMFETQKLRDELINQRQASELALLKSQVNPHFLFNTLNNIYSLVYNKSDKAPQAVMKFSSIMRYVLYDTKHERVPLEKEIEYLKNYIELQGLRFKQPGLVKMDIEGNTDGITIAPMLLIPFVENAFKHGSKNHQPSVIIQLYADNHMIQFEVSNFTEKTRRTNNEQFGGIGLLNIKRRLELIYKDKYSLETKDWDDQYTAKLLIEHQ